MSTKSGSEMTQNLQEKGAIDASKNIEIGNHRVCVKSVTGVFAPRIRQRWNPLSVITPSVNNSSLPSPF